MNAPTVDPRLLHALGLLFQTAAAAVDHYFGEGTAEGNPGLVVEVMRLIGEQERRRDFQEAAALQRQSAQSLAQSLDAIQEEVSAIAVAILEAPL
ncbi:hypothetical protein [Methyloversatilis discipulorum]|uniref:hypothetical protein n=1 Tax=Methyloversatilis discipulorum TaxID=1119528 RepID=UPI003F3930E9